MKKKYATSIVIFSFLGLSAQTNPYYQGDKCVTDISLSSQAISIFTSDNKIYTWGRNHYGMIGDGTINDYGAPNLYLRPALPDFVSISHGHISSTGLDENGVIYTWGTNLNGVLGNGTTTDNFIPIQVSADTDWVKVVNTWVNNIALKSNGTLWGWGNVDNCALTHVPAAPQPNNFYTHPIQISPDTDWIDIGAGAGITFAIKSNGTLWARGRNSDYALGVSNSNNGQCINTITQVGTDTNWKKVVPSNMGGFTLALKTDNTLWGWGAYGNNGSQIPVQTPVQIGTDTWKEISSGLAHSLAIRTDGTLWEWGAGYYDQSLNIYYPNNAPVTVPTQVGTNNNWIKVAAGGSCSFALRADNTVWAWGLGSGFGSGVASMYGNSNTPSSSTPVLIFQCTDASTTEHELSNIILYPNPTVNKIFWAQKIAIEKVTVFDMSGKQVLSQKVSDFSLDVSDLSSGTYLIKLETKDKSYYNSKFIKK